jgi:photosystem II stability/assembly factor-like uncharacterized protein
MKNFILSLGVVILSLFNFTAFGQGGWTLQTNPTNKTGGSMQFVSATEGWIDLIPGHGTLPTDLPRNALLHTTNGGDSWNVVILNSNDVADGIEAPNSRISFVNPSIGWAIKTFTNPNGNPQEDALGVVLYKTINGGATWNRTVLSNTIGDVGLQVQFVDANYGWISIYNMNTGTPTYLKTTDGGSNWTPTNGGGIFYYVNATIGYAFSINSSGVQQPTTFSKTTDGGTNWTPQYEDNVSGGEFNPLNAIQFTDVNNGWIVGFEGKIFHTTNGGTNWNPVTNALPNTNYRNKTLSFINNTTGWISSNYGVDDDGDYSFVLSTTDGGATWSTQVLPFDDDVYAIDFWDANHGWAAQDKGPIAKYSSSTGGPYSNATLNGPWFMYANVSLRGSLLMNTQIDPFDNNLNYFVFDGNGNITGFNGFPGPWTGNYTVNASGAISGTVTNGIDSFPIDCQLISTTEGIGDVAGKNWRFHKIANPDVLKDKITGTLTTDDCGSIDVILNIDNNGNITSATGLTGPVVGQVYTDLGVYIGHMTTGEGNETHWHELTIRGFYSNNNLVGQLRLSSDSCGNALSNLVRTDNLGVDDDYIVSKFITIYPNPNNGTFYFSLKDTNSKVKAEIYNLSGQKVFEASNFEIQPQNEVHFAPQSKGFFLIKINDGENTYNEKIMIQ